VNTRAVAGRRLPSIPAGPGLLTSVLQLLRAIDDLPAGATGALPFGDQGVILLEARKICWALARSMRFHLTDILRSQSTEELTQDVVEQVYRRCKQTGTPIGGSVGARGSCDRGRTPFGVVPTQRGSYRGTSPRGSFTESVRHPQ
jgi:hypothetical protein